MDKILHWDESIFNLVNRHPEVKDIMVKLGFDDIAKPGMLQTAGRFMTLSKGIALKKIGMETVQQTFMQHGFTIQK
ncbi:DUF1858 domain-containing protein [Paenibacillus polymyxa]|uniref:M1-755 n=1 Tax=Paenibacillus polymyxa (strain SC2) TaxID=886882 RepID=E3EF85_PAEPS|nr:DUF1858 domain-containing protein [Paenibacillus polymyxa]ADO54605.1 M1-755 [Paenibacillus polymyxa SC2]OAZ39278.1 hypothetical protein A9Z39_25585 [Paenibacillus polymyxa]WPQ57489.1 DUF1858 domain-containing protein [Paenibacillus polymyxa]CCC83517.1 hypothetical protein PPM_0580 [Paenibacillus polymyxa M1]